MTLTRENKIEEHPCFNKDVMHTNARVHLPVAPKCNIQCNYCNRKYDCINESRPGVTSSMLTPTQAVEYLRTLNSVMENLKVIGIAGPGDPFANPIETMETLRQCHQAFPDKIFCLSTNGLELEPYIDEIADLGVTHVHAFWPITCCGSRTRGIMHSSSPCPFSSCILQEYGGGRARIW